ncbi:MAG: hypothetical protein COY66_04055 [Candidatus Kerfeldbacteria bacterium CG_4_10_14_0_8_um_filter_42_10]|uniref:Uncharacterized protein n=1 Tax=Candidatus Kerfeldbacteria bacterium CG_4_10_14_0_8_um_filter_42_10 TaxID=2014248 RepID=A0A2M7RJC0_9BACT|nr:MAG: hypothetical protein COY66_04055 [Candidatus Kerfeldbacteria bacterium CG_4_10_14_0_8_um_filter_42_10]
MEYAIIVILMLIVVWRFIPISLMPSKFRKREDAQYRFELDRKYHFFFVRPIPKECPNCHASGALQRVTVIRLTEYKSQADAQQREPVTLAQPQIDPYPYYAECTSCRATFEKYYSTDPGDE